MEFSPRKSKSKVFCCVFDCSSTARKHETVRFFHFPKAGKSFVNIKNAFGEPEKIDRRKAWEIILKMGKKTTESMRVCSLHFCKEDFFLPDYSSNSRRLLKTAIPSLRLPTSTIDTKKLSEKKKVENDARNQRTTNRQKDFFQEISEVSSKDKNVDSTLKKSALVDNSNSISVIDISSETIIRNQDANINLSCPGFVDVGVQVDADSFPKETTDVGVQVKSGDLRNPSFCDNIMSDKELSTVTGIEKIEILNSLVKIVEIIAPRFQFFVAKLIIRERIMMCFMKLKHNLSYALLAVLFRTCTERHCQNVILNMIDILSFALKWAIVFPTKEEIAKNLPTCFEDFKETRIILDCTEIEIQKPENLCCQLATYSFYKSKYTIKYMTGVTPGGLISFISKGYGGRASDKAIFEQSGLIEKLEERDTDNNRKQGIMVDKGFLIDDVCKDYGIKLIRPPFMRNKIQFSEEESLENCNIASARVHVERDNQRLKVFAILGSKMPSCLVLKCDKIMTILCAIVNLSSPILQDCRFFQNNPEEISTNENIEDET